MTYSSELLLCALPLQKKKDDDEEDEAKQQVPRLYLTFKGNQLS